MTPSSTHRSPVAAYLEALDAGDFERAVQPFSADVVYVRPAFHPGESGTQEVTGRAMLLEFFRRRGRRPVRHCIDVLIQDGRDVFGDGRLIDADGETKTRWLCHAELDADGLIGRYVVALA